MFIRFSGLDTTKPILVIDDDGHGMTKSQLEKNWLVIGTNNKLKTGISKEKSRILIGEKGLGRLGLDRLSVITVLQTFPKSGRKGTELVIEWNKYAKTQDRLENITHKIFQIPKKIDDPISGELTIEEHGTRIILQELKDKWSVEDLRRLKRELSLLVSPFSGINDFSIHIDSGLSYSDVDGEVLSSEILKAAEWKLVSKLDKEFNIEHKMTHREGAEFSFSSPWSKVFLKDSDVPLCGPITFELYFYPRKSIREISFNKAQISDFLRNNQGIRIYRDHFRVMPYGEPTGEGDWLNLALRRTQSPGGVRQTGHWKVGYNQIVGAIFIERDKNGALLDQTNREGIVEGKAYYDLRKYALHAIEFFEDRRQSYEISQRKKTRFEEAKEDAKESSNIAINAVNKLRETADDIVKQVEKSKEFDTKIIRSTLFKSIDLVKKAVVEVSDTQDELGKASEEQQREFEEQKDTLGNLASLGILSTTFGHETLANANLVVNNTEIVKRNILQLKSSEDFSIIPLLIENVNDIEYAAKRIETFAEFTLKNVRRDKRKRKKVYINNIIEDVFRAFSEELENRRGITLDLQLPRKTYSIRAFHIDWESIIINLITNAVWALDDIPKEDRKIRVKLYETNQSLNLSFADSGIGIEAGVIDKIFAPTFSTKRNQRGDVIGTGMGLAIVENFVNGYGGSINVESPSDLGGAQFHISIPLIYE